MSNMSYCRFQNTLNDFEDCKGVMEDIAHGNYDEEEEGTVSSDEKNAMTQLLISIFGLLETLEIDIDREEIIAAGNKLNIDFNNWL